MSAQDIMKRFGDYARSVGANHKVIGTHAYKSSNYNQKENRGRWVRFVSAKRGGDIIVWDNKKGNVKIGKTDNYM